MRFEKKYTQDSKIRSTIYLRNTLKVRKQNLANEKRYFSKTVPFFCVEKKLQQG